MIKYKSKHFASNIHYNVCVNGGIYLSVEKSPWSLDISKKIKEKTIEINEKKELLISQGFDKDYSLTQYLLKEEISMVNKIAKKYLEYEVYRECGDVKCSCKEKIDRLNKEMKEHTYSYYSSKNLGKNAIVIKEEHNVELINKVLKITMTENRIKTINNRLDFEKKARFIFYLNLDSYEIYIEKVTPKGNIIKLKNKNDFIKYISKSNTNLEIMNINNLNNELIMRMFNRTGFKEYSEYTSKSFNIEKKSVEKIITDIGNNTYLDKMFYFSLLNYLMYYEDNRLIESILKSGHVSYGLSSIKNNRKLKNSFKEQFNMSRPLMKFLKDKFKMDGDFDYNNTKSFDFYLLFSKMEQVGGNLSNELIDFFDVEFMTGQYNDFNNLVNWKNLVEEFCYSNNEIYDYLLRVDQFQGVYKTEALSILIDYNRMAKEMDLEYDKKPNSLKRSHDVLMRDYNFMINQENIADYERIKYKLKRYEYKNDRYSIIVPDNLELIVEEGRVLNHCVGSYANRIIKGETIVLFVRDNKKLDVPYFTIEVKNNRVAQCRGKNNKRIDDNKLNGFIESYKEKII